MTDALMDALGAIGSCVEHAVTSLSFGARPSVADVGEIWMKERGPAHGLYVVLGPAPSPAVGWPMKHLADGTLANMRGPERAPAGMWERIATAPVGAGYTSEPTPSPYYVADDGPAVMETPLTYRTGGTVVQCAPPRHGLARVAARVADAFDAGAGWCRARAAKLRALGDR